MYKNREICVCLFCAVWIIICLFLAIFFAYLGFGEHDRDELDKQEMVIFFIVWLVISFCSCAFIMYLIIHAYKTADEVVEDAGVNGGCGGCGGCGACGWTRGFKSSIWRQQSLASLKCMLLCCEYFIKIINILTIFSCNMIFSLIN